MNYPTELAPRGNTTDQYITANGSTVEVHDPYRFLEDPSSNETKAWVAAERNLTATYFQNCKARKDFKDELQESLDYPKIGLMKRHGDYYYFNYNSGLQNQAVYYRVKQKNSFRIDYEDPTKGSEVFLDPNEFSKEGIASVFGINWSPDNQ